MLSYNVELIDGTTNMNRNVLTHCTYDQINNPAFEQKRSFRALGIFSVQRRQVLRLSVCFK